MKSLLQLCPSNRHTIRIDEPQSDATWFESDDHSIDSAHDRVTFVSTERDMPTLSTTHVCAIEVDKILTDDSDRYYERPVDDNRLTETSGKHEHGSAR